MRALPFLFPILALGIIGGGTVSGVIVSLAVSNSSVYLASSSGYLYMLKPYSPANVIGYVGNVSSIYFFQGSLYVLKGKSLYLFKNHSLQFLTKISSFHPPYYIKGKSLYLITGKLLSNSSLVLFHGPFALSIENKTFSLFHLGKLVLRGSLPFIPSDFYYNGSLFLLSHSTIYSYSREGGLRRICVIPNVVSFYYANSSCLFLQGYEYNGKWNVSLLEIVSKSSGKLLKVIPCSWFSFPYLLSQKEILDVVNWKVISKGVIKADYNGIALVMLHENSTLEIISKNKTGWIKLQETPAIIRAVGKYCFAYFLLVAHKESYIAIYSPSKYSPEIKKRGGKFSVQMPSLPAFIFLGVLIGLGLLGYYVFKRRRLFLFFFFLDLSDANKAIRPIAPAAPMIIATSLNKYFILGGVGI